MIGVCLAMACVPPPDNGASPAGQPASIGCRDAERICPPGTQAFEDRCYVADDFDGPQPKPNATARDSICPSNGDSVAGHDGRAGHPMFGGGHVDRSGEMAAMMAGTDGGPDAGGILGQAGAAGSTGSAIMGGIDGTGPMAGLPSLAGVPTEAATCVERGGRCVEIAQATCDGQITDHVCPGNGSMACCFGDVSARSVGPECVVETACAMEGMTECSGGDTVRACERNPQTGCLAWSAPRLCAVGQRCIGMACAADNPDNSPPGCNDQCNPGQSQCAGNLVQLCGRDVNGCNVWSDARPCADGAGCANGQCPGGAGPCAGNPNACPQINLVQCIDAQLFRFCTQ
ncbi:MAG: hypothetical protein VX589_11695, partial [Myxococcota bacterium]|nr:hypothetical protein [Myxococcota bacterium]